MSLGQRDCPVCGATHSFPLVRLEWQLFADHPLLVTTRKAIPEGTLLFGVDACTRCGMSFSSPIAPQDAFDAYYSCWSRYAFGTDNLSGPPDKATLERYQGTAERVAPYIPASDARILDVGCLEGGLLDTIRTFGHTNIAGVDPAPESMRRAAQKAIDVRTGTVDAIPFPDGTFDLILCVHVLEHIADLSSLDIFRVLSHRGRLYIEVPDAASYQADSPDIYADLSLEHINHFDLPSLVRLLHSRGFRALETGVRTYPAVPGSPAMQDSIWGIFERDITIPEHEIKDPSDPLMLRRYLDESQRRALKLNARLEAFVAPNEAFRIWGTGHGAFRLLGFSALRTGVLSAATDINPLYWGKRLGGTVVVRPDAFLAGDGKVVVTSAINGQNIAAHLRKQGWKGEIFVP